MQKNNHGYILKKGIPPGPSKIFPTSTQQAREKAPLLCYFSPKLQIIWYTCVVLLYKCCQYSKIN